MTLVRRHLLTVVQSAEVRSERPARIHNSLDCRCHFRCLTQSCNNFLSDNDRYVCPNSAESLSLNQQRPDNSDTDYGSVG